MTQFISISNTRAQKLALILNAFNAGMFPGQNLEWIDHNETQYHGFILTVSNSINDTVACHRVSIMPGVTTVPKDALNNPLPLSVLDDLDGVGS